MTTPRQPGESLKAWKRRMGASGGSDKHQDDRTDTQIFTDTPKGRNALDKWARNYDKLNGAPEGPEDC